MNTPRLLPLSARVSLLLSLMIAPISYADDEPVAKKKTVISLGVAGIYAPKFTGSDKYEAKPLPVIFIQFDRLTIGGAGGISYDLFRGEGVKAGVGLGYFSGRDESDADYLKGLGDLDASADIGFFARKRLGSFYLSANIKRDLSKDVGGITSAISAGYMHRVSPQLSLNTNVLARWMDDAHAEAMFGVSAQQAQSSSLLQTEAKAGIESGGLSLTALYLMSPHWVVTNTVSLTRYLGDAKLSPIVKEPTSIMFMTSMSYKF